MNTTPPGDDLARHVPAPPVLEAERQVVGACLMSRAALEAASETLTAASFWDAELAGIYQAAIDMHAAGTPIDPLAVHQHLTTTGQLALLRRSGPAILHQLAGATVLTHPQSVRHHAKTVADDAYRRQLHTAFLRGAYATGDHRFEPEVVAGLLDGVNRVAAQASADPSAAWLEQDFTASVEAIDDDRDAGRIPTPWIDFNEAVGLYAGQLVIVGADTGGAKSVFGLNVGGHVALSLGEGVLIHSLEMGRREVHWRLLASVGKIPLHHIKNRTLDAAERETIAKLTPRIAAAPMLIDDASTITLATIRARLEHMRKRVPTRLVVVDYLQLATGERRAERRDLEVAGLSRGLKMIAKEMGVCVIALSQLNKNFTSRADHRPTKHDLRESGALAHDADTVVLLYREDMYERETPRQNEIDLIIDKQRSGPSGFSITCAFQGQFARIVDMAKPEWSPSGVLDGKR
jgi:replicative DNA helicase